MQGVNHPYIQLPLHTPIHPHCSCLLVSVYAAKCMTALVCASHLQLGLVQKQLPEDRSVVSCFTITFPAGADVRTVTSPAFDC